MTRKSEPTKEAKITEVAHELTDQQLDLVAGGKTTSSAKLYEAVSTGKHFKKATVDLS
jgi:hypothetical protein